MNVYDFDGTIYRGDSTLHFFWYCLKCQPALARFLPVQVLGLLRYGLGVGGKDAAKSAFLCLYAAYTICPRGYRRFGKRMRQTWRPGIWRSGRRRTWWFPHRQPGCCNRCATAWALC